MKRLQVLIIGMLIATFWFSPFDVWSMGSRVPAVGSLVEDFHLTDLEGKSQSLSQYRG